MSDAVLIVSRGAYTAANNYDTSRPGIAWAIITIDRFVARMFNQPGVDEADTS